MKLSLKVESTIREVNALLEASCCPSDAEIKKLGINDIKRLLPTLSDDDRRRISAKLSPQQKIGIPREMLA